MSALGVLPPTVMGLMHLARGERSRWRPLLAGVVLRGAARMLRSGAWGMILASVSGSSCMPCSSLPLLPETASGALSSNANCPFIQSRLSVIR